MKYSTAGSSFWNDCWEDKKFGDTDAIRDTLDLLKKAELGNVSFINLNIASVSKILWQSEDSTVLAPTYPIVVQLVLYCFPRK